MFDKSFMLKNLPNEIISIITGEVSNVEE